MPILSSTASKRRSRAERRVRFEALYAAHYESIYRYAARRVSSDQEVPSEDQSYWLVAACLELHHCSGKEEASWLCRWG